MKKYTALDSAIRDICGADRTIVQRRYTAGGDINEAYALVLDDGNVLFMKSNTASALSCFEAEAEGLDAIRRTGAIRVPDVLGLGTEQGTSFLLLEFISQGSRVRGYWETFALQLAAMHSPAARTAYGFEHDNWIGASKQINAPRTSWIDFFRDCRLKPQLEAADGYFTDAQRRKADFLLDHLDRYLTEPAGPSLLHGDLWAGNMITGSDGRGWLIDPAVYYGHPEADIAMTQLFGGFPEQFYEAYAQAGRLEPGYRDRRDLYNLYHLLNHLNLFGRAYLRSVTGIIERY